MAFWFCIAEQKDETNDSEMFRHRNVINVGSQQEARKSFSNLRKGLKRLRIKQKILLEEFGFFGPFEDIKTAYAIKDRHIRKAKRHKWD